MLSMHGRTRLLVSTGMAVCAFDVPVIVLQETAALTAASRIAALWDPCYASGRGGAAVKTTLLVSCQSRSNLVT